MIIVWLSKGADIISDSSYKNTISYVLLIKASIYKYNSILIYSPFPWLFGFIFFLVPRK